MLDIVEFPDPELTRLCHDVVSFDDELRQLANTMVDVMYANEGVGLAAPQVGASKRVVVIDSSAGMETNQLVTLVNPRVTWRSVETVVGPEGCLSMPGMVLQVPRAVAVDVEYHDVMGIVRVMKCDGFKARIVQHEIDHLDGVLMIDRAGPLARKLAMKGLSRNR